MRMLPGVLALTSLFSALTSAQTAPDDRMTRVPLHVLPGAPLRLYLTGRVSKRVGTRVTARVMEPVFAFDHEVIPAGTVAYGRVSRTPGVGDGSGSRRCSMATSHR